MRWPVHPIAVFCFGMLSIGVQAQDTLVFQLRGTVFDLSNNKPLPRASIEVVGTDGSSYTTYSDSAGHFSGIPTGPQRTIKANTRYAIRVAQERYLALNDELSTIDLHERTIFEKEYYLKPGCIGGDPLPRFGFTARSARLEKEVEVVIQEIADMLNDNPQVVVELRGHCDDIEPASLGIKRAEVIKAALIERGIEAERLKTRGVGATEPVITPAELARMTKAERVDARARNRRVDLKILSDDFHK